MTRINLVDPKDLADQHLMAEWREIKMIPPALRRSITAQNKLNNLSFSSTIGLMNKIPSLYTLNTGHVTFFYNKLGFLKERYNLLTGELLDRGYELSDLREYDVFINDIPKLWHGLWQPGRDEIQINIERIVLRLNEKPDFYRYRGEKEPVSFYEDRYNQYLTNYMLTGSVPSI